MSSDFKSAIIDTLSNIIDVVKDRRVKNTFDPAAFIVSIKKELLKNDLPFFNISQSTVNKDIIILELPFTKECEISVAPISFNDSKKEAAIKINGVLTRRIRLEQLDSVYMNQVGIALCDYLKRFKTIQNRIITNK